MNFLMRSGVSKVSGAVERLKRPLDPLSESESFVSEQSDDVIDSQESNSLTLEDEVRIHAKQKEVSKSNHSRSKKINRFQSVVIFIYIVLLVKVTIISHNAGYSSQQHTNSIF